MREIFIKTLLALMQGKKTCIKASLTAENLELMFQIGREYGFVTVAMKMEGFSSIQVATDKATPLKISMRLLNADSTEVCVKRISEEEYKGFVENNLN